ncbi:MAG TPA: hypothetical protein VEH04_01290 [Verrucomicrobiae bacterium]|nr:hypothetical protein [Verrucomicrobiae bacterium]
MRFRIGSSVSLLAAVASLLLVLSAAAAQARDFKFEAQLIWATMSESSPDPQHKPVDEKTRERLAKVNLKWKNYFLVRKVDASVPEKGAKEVVLSDKCKISIRQVDEENFEVSLFGQGKSVLKRMQNISKGEMLVLGGNAPDSTSWFVAVRRTE